MCVYMVRKTFYLSNQQVREMRKMKLATVSEHIRRAIDEYIAKHKAEDLNVSQSKSLLIK